ncbi:hypothetical protein SDC9_195182 [bioreactor metagenome]|uniref:Uncharacterized protein n=1 Tax=bioreactor metagenome TaxID=1076179 RepID=A0A645IAV5_9ZZZZ
MDLAFGGFAVISAILLPILGIVALISFISVSYWAIRALKVYINKNS